MAPYLRKRVGAKNIMQYYNLRKKGPQLSSSYLPKLACAIASDEVKDE